MARCRWVPVAGAWLVVTLLPGVTGGASGQTQKPSPAPVQAAAAQGTAEEGDQSLLKQEQLDQMLAPIALYPDPLLTQLLMASTYPLEVVQADRWVKEHKDLTGDALTAELEKQPWDASVKSLVNFPQILAMMSEKLDLTVKLGDAFLEQQADVMNTIQKLRGKAKAAGNLESNERRTVTVEAAAPATQPSAAQVTPEPSQIIVVQPADPQVIYIEDDDPDVVYGAWWYPYYPPAPYPPPHYWGSNLLSFGLGAAWGYAWGHSDWHGEDIDIDIDQNLDINHNIDRDKYKAEAEQRRTERQGGREARQGERGQGTWQHDRQHRQGVPYKDQRTAQKYGAADRSRQTAAARDAYRGRTDAGRADVARGGASQLGSSGVDRSRGQAGASRDVARTSTGTRASTFDSIDRGGSSARASSQRGYSSRSSSSYSGSRGAGGSRGYSGGGGRGGRAGGGRR